MGEKKYCQLIFTGDMMLSQEYLNYIKKNDLDYLYPFTEIRSIFNKADLVFTNFESTLDKSGQSMRPNTGPQLYSPPEILIKLFKKLNIKIVSIANNHIKDYGEISLINTKQILKDHDFYVFGAGKNYNEAKEASIINMGNFKIAFSGYTTNTAQDGISPDIGAIIASDVSAGCLYYDIQKIKEDIINLKNNADIICVSLHWGYELFNYPSPGQILLAHQIIDAGADIIIGHHPHTIQGYEIYKNKYIFYSIGNFFFWNYFEHDHIPNESNDFVITSIKVSNSGIDDVEILPCSLNSNYKINVYSGVEKDKFMFKLDSISKKITNNDYNKFWLEYKEKRDNELNKLAAEASVQELLLKVKEDKLTIIRKFSWKFLANYIKIFFNMLWR